MAIRLKVVTPTRTVVDAEVSELTAPGVVGEFGVFPMHVTFLGALELGVLSYVEGGAKKSLIVHGGYTEVIDDVVTVLADEAEFPEEVDVAAARADLSRIDSELASVSDTPETVDRLLAERRRAEVRAASKPA